MKSHPTAKDLAVIYTPNDEELALAAAQSQRSAPRVGFLILLKTFQRLGYFPQISGVPMAISTHIAQSIGFEAPPADLENYDSGRTRIRHMGRILVFLRVSPYGDDAKAVLNSSAKAAATTRDDLADIINVSIEELVRQRYELPGFTTFLKTAKQARVLVNAGYHRLLHQALGETGRSRIDELLAPSSRNTKSAWDLVKQEPRRPTVGHIREFT